jgi:hypothetical protein
VKRLEIYGIVFGTVLILAAAIVFHAYKADTGKTQARVDQIQQDAAPKHEEAQQEHQQVAASETANQTALAATLLAISKQQQAPVDYDKLVAMILARMGPGFKVETKPADPNLPDAPSSVTVTGPNAGQVIRDKILDCDKLGASLTSCQVTVSNAQKDLAIEKKDHQTTKGELDATRKQVNGTFWTKVGRGMTHSICGGGGTAAGIEVGRKNDAKAGVIIGGAAFVGCELFAHLRKK